MKVITQMFINFIRKNKQIEILAYLAQNYLGINYQGWGTFAEDPKNIHKHFIDVSENYVTKLSSEAFKNKVILELGTGFSRSGMLHLIKEYQLKHVYCYDKFNCLIDDEMHLIKKAGLESYLDRLTYIVGDPKKIIDKIGENKVDTVVSNAVLEFVDDLDKLAKTLYTVMQDGAVGYHRVDLRCHNKFRSLGALYFHTFSDALWRSMGQRVGQLNRKLKKDYINAFVTNSFECKAKVIDVFSSQVLADAETYLTSKSIKDYKTAELDLFIIKK